MVDENQKEREFIKSEIYQLFKESGIAPEYGIIESDMLYYRFFSGSDVMNIRRTLADSKLLLCVRGFEKTVVNFHLTSDLLALLLLKYDWEPTTWKKS